MNETQSRGQMVPKGLWRMESIPEEIQSLSKLEVRVYLNTCKITIRVPRNESQKSNKKTNYFEKRPGVSRI